jgi:DNA-binding YbaB/EbfC family protein
MKLDYNQMMKQVQKMQKDMVKIQEELKDEKLEATSGGGMVKVLGNGQGEILKIDINPDAIDVGDKEMLEDMIIVAVNEVLEKAKGLQEQRLRGLTGGIGLPGLM